VTRKADLRLQRAGTVLNLTSKQQETALGKALKKVVARLQADFGLQLHHAKTAKLADILNGLEADFPEVPFGHVRPDTSMKPDGGILSVVDREGRRHAILVVEVKNQGTNVERVAEGLKEQAKGNAIERLGKNVIGFRAMLLTENIMPFVCFGYGCDFAKESSILDRVVTIAMFGSLNEINLFNVSMFNRGSFYFQEKKWSAKKMEEVMYEVASRSIDYYRAKYGRRAFPPAI
jgi:type II restriction enzyme